MDEKKTDRRGCPPGLGTRVGAVLPNGTADQLGRIGNPPHEPTQEKRDLVRTYAKVMSQEMIAAAFEPQISVDTLQRHYRRELDAGKREAVAAVGGKILAKALAGNVTCAIFYMRTQGGWSTKHELAGPGGLPLQAIDLTSFLADKDEDECRAIKRVLEALAAAGGVDVPALLGECDGASQPADSES